MDPIIIRTTRLSKFVAFYLEKDGIVVHGSIYPNNGFKDLVQSHVALYGAQGISEFLLEHGVLQSEIDSHHITRSFNVFKLLQAIYDWQNDYQPRLMMFSFFDEGPVPKLEFTFVDNMKLLSTDTIDAKTNLIGIDLVNERSYRNILEIQDCLNTTTLPDIVFEDKSKPFRPCMMQVNTISGQEILLLDSDENLKYDNPIKLIGFDQTEKDKEAAKEYFGDSYNIVKLYSSVHPVLAILACIINSHA